MRIGLPAGLGPKHQYPSLAPPQSLRHSLCTRMFAKEDFKGGCIGVVKVACLRALKRG